MASLTRAYLGIARLLAQAERLTPADPFAATVLRERAAAMACDALGAVLVDESFVAEMETVQLPGARNPVAMPPQERTQFVDIEVALLRAAGLPKDEARALIHEAWAVYPTSAPQLLSGAKLLDRWATLRETVCQNATTFRTMLGLPEPVSPALPDAMPPSPRPWWRRMKGRRLLYVIGGTLIIAVNVVGAEALVAHVAEPRGDAGVGGSVGLGTQLIFFGAPPAKP
ncbi:hypothetical protein [Actinomadura sp. 6N118]|uniref:hypothetical protein n=1 Tax=Actinomadura sp. 6N118 TaxID=3375151 RepID=UPI0037ABE139